MSLLRGWKQGLTVVGIFLLVFLGLRYLFPFLLPFMLGLVLALTAEPGAKFLQRSLHFSPAGASFAAVTAVLALLAGGVWLIFSVLARRMMDLLQAFSGGAGQLSEGLDALEGWAVSLAQKAPEALSEPLTVRAMCIGTAQHLHQGGLACAVFAADRQDLIRAQID